jgi:hypothetical protein
VVKFAKYTEKVPFLMLNPNQLPRKLYGLVGIDFAILDIFYLTQNVRPKVVKMSKYTEEKRLLMLNPNQLPRKLYGLVEHDFAILYIFYLIQYHEPKVVKSAKHTEKTLFLTNQTATKVIWACRE